MKAARSILIGLTTLALLGVPAAAVAISPTVGAHGAAFPSLARVAVAQHPTSIRYLPFSHIHAPNRTMLVRGQVVGKAQGQKGSLAGVQVKLFRQLDGNPTWVYLGSDTTDNGAFPQFTFSTLTRQNAHYKVVFAGNATFGPSSKVTWLTVFRLFNGLIVDGTGTATLKGHVDPYYTHKPISLQKRSCPSCSYVTVKTVTTGIGGVYSFGLPAPQTGRWWWRVSIPGTGAYMASFGGTFTTELT